MSQLLIDLLTQGGLAGVSGVLFLLLMQERKERRQTQDKVIELSTGLIEHSTKTQHAISEFTTLLEKVGEVVREVAVRQRADRGD